MSRVLEPESARMLVLELCVGLAGGYLLWLLPFAPRGLGLLFMPALVGLGSVFGMKFFRWFMNRSASSGERLTSSIGAMVWFLVANIFGVIGILSRLLLLPSLVWASFCAVGELRAAGISMALLLNSSGKSLAGRVSVALTLGTVLGMCQAGFNWLYYRGPASTPSAKIATMASHIVYNPMEELVLRAFGLFVCAQLGMNIILAAVVTSAAFALMHTHNDYHPLIQSYHFASGCIYFAIYVSTGSVLVVSAVHWLKNTIGDFVAAERFWARIANGRRFRDR